MYRSLIAAAVIIATLVVARSSFAQDAGDRQYSVTAGTASDVQQQTLQAFDPASKRTIEVFPGTYVSPFGALMMKRIEEMFTRVGEADRATLLAKRVGEGFDRSIIGWRAQPDGQTVAVAVRYYRAALSQLDMELSDDYGRPEPLDPADYEFFAVGVCARSGGDTWTCREEDLALVAKRHNVSVPKDPAARNAVAEHLLELVLAKQ